MDVFFIAVVLVLGFIGYKKGFVKTIVGMMSLVASVVLAVILCPVVKDLFISMGIKDAVYAVVLSKVSSKIDGAMVAVPSFLASLVEGGKNSAVSDFATRVTDMVLNVFAFISVVLFSRILIFIIEKVMKVAEKIPGIKASNKILGLAFGLLKGLIIVYIIIILFVGILPISSESSFKSQIENSFTVNCVNKIMPMENIIIE